MTIKDAMLKKITGIFQLKKEIKASPEVSEEVRYHQYNYRGEGKPCNPRDEMTRHQASFSAAGPRSAPETT